MYGTERIVKNCCFSGEKFQQKSYSIKSLLVKPSIKLKSLELFSHSAEFWSEKQIKTHWKCFYMKKSNRKSFLMKSTWNYNMCQNRILDFSVYNTQNKQKLKFDFSISIKTNLQMQKTTTKNQQIFIKSINDFYALRAWCITR